MAKRWKTLCTDCYWEGIYDNEAEAVAAEHVCEPLPVAEVAFPEDPWERAQTVERTVRWIAVRILGRLPAYTVELEDLISVGRIGAFEAGKRFDPNHGASFHTFAQHRISGKIIDYLRDIDTSSRNDRAKGREWYTGSLDEMLQQRRPDGSPNAMANVATEAMQRNAPDPLGDFLDLDALRGAWSVLNEKEQELIRRYFWEELKMHEIATLEGVTESRICQRMGKATAKLRRSMERQAVA